MAIEYGEAVPRNQVAAKRPIPRIEKRSRPRFVLAVHPHKWLWDPIEGCWLPELGRMLQDPGVQGVGLDGDGKIDDSLARQWYAKTGHILIEDGDERLQKVLAKGQYVARHKTGAGWAYTFAWEGYQWVGANVEWGENRKLRVKVQRFIVDSGIIPPMPPALAALEIRQQVRRVSRLGTKAAKNPNLPAVGANLAAAEQKLEAMRKAAGVTVAVDELEEGELGDEPVGDGVDDLADAEPWGEVGEGAPDPLPDPPTNAKLRKPKAT